MEILMFIDMLKDLRDTKMLLQVATLAPSQFFLSTFKAGNGNGDI